MPPEVVDTMANLNYNSIRPRPIDTAVMFDMAKIRRLVDEATNLAVRATSDIPSPVLTSIHDGLSGISGLKTWGAGGSVHGGKMSKGRKFRMREQASQILARAYRLDETATSALVIQGSSIPVRQAGELVLQRNPKDCEASYVNFFHERVLRRQVGLCTSLQPLTDIISDRPGEPEFLRTRAALKVFKGDPEGAAQDLSLALSMLRLHSSSHTEKQTDQVQVEAHANKRQLDIILAEKDQPSSLEGQLHYQRASVYLHMACKYVRKASLTTEIQNEGEQGFNMELLDEDSWNRDEPPLPDNNISKDECNKMAKIMARRALRDYMSFVSLFEYSPDVPIRALGDFEQRVSLLACGVRNPRPSGSSIPTQQHKVYTIAELFDPVPPADLPPYPQEAAGKPRAAAPQTSTCERATFHPLLIEALHALLLCHCLLQTSTKELVRHCYMVARIVRLVDGYPCFQVEMSPAWTDWFHVLAHNKSRIPLSATWRQLCMPAPLPTDPRPCPQKEKAAPNAAKAAASLMPQAPAPAAPKPQPQPQRKDGVYKQSATLAEEALLDATAQALGVCATGGQAGGKSTAPCCCAGCGTGSGSGDPSKRQGDGTAGRRLSERAAMIVYWIQQAPVVTGTAKRRKKQKKAVQTEDLEAEVTQLDLQDSINS